MTTAQELDERYGRARKRRTPLIIAIVVAALVVGAFAWTTATRQMQSVDADDLGYDLVDAHSVTVRFQLTGVQGKDVACVVEALDDKFGIVGWKVVEIAATEEDAHALSVTVPTVAQATTGLVNTCWVA
ncbi:MAG: DUF4307 domain-containing protein [Microbacterium sp.]